MASLLTYDFPSSDSQDSDYIPGKKELEEADKPQEDESTLYDTSELSSDEEGEGDSIRFDSNDSMSCKPSSPVAKESFTDDLDGSSSAKKRKAPTTAAKKKPSAKPAPAAKSKAKTKALPKAKVSTASKVTSKKKVSTASKVKKPADSKSRKAKATASGSSKSKVTKKAKK